MSKVIQVIAGWENENFQWTGLVCGLHGKRAAFDKLKSGQAVSVPDDAADKMIATGYFKEVVQPVKSKDKIETKIDSLKDKEK